MTEKLGCGILFSLLLLQRHFVLLLVCTNLKRVARAARSEDRYAWSYVELKTGITRRTDSNMPNKNRVQQPAVEWGVPLHAKLHVECGWLAGVRDHQENCVVAAGDRPGSGNPRSARSANSTAHPSPPSSALRCDTGGCRRRAAASGRPSSSAWPPSGRKRVRGTHECLKQQYLVIKASIGTLVVMFVSHWLLKIRITNTFLFFNENDTEHFVHLLHWLRR